MILKLIYSPCNLSDYSSVVLTLIATLTVGKSTALKCALSVVGQVEDGHVMKTKSTSDVLCMERCIKSTVPFGLDDPKTTQGIGEMLIDLCNERKIGNMRVGLRSPQTIPILCCNLDTLKEWKQRLVA